MVKNIGGSCIKDDTLIIMLKHYNNINKNDNINIDLPKEQIIKELEERFGERQNEWVKNKVFQDLPDEITEELLYYTFKPNGPQGKFTWLSTVDLEYAMKQYKIKHPDFKFLGAVPIDFAELIGLDINNINFDEEKRNGNKRFGVIFNLDEHYKGGSHWVSLFFDLDKKQIYFSDSVGKKPVKRIKEYIDKIINYMGKNVDYQYNKMEHQKGNSECGVYSINWILRLLNGKTFEHLTSKRLSDEDVNKCRLRYFNTNK